MNESNLCVAICRVGVALRSLSPGWGIKPVTCHEKTFAHRMVRLEKDLWRIRFNQGELEAAEQQELRLYFDELHPRCWEVKWRVTKVG